MRLDDGRRMSDVLYEIVKAVSETVLLFLFKHREEEITKPQSFFINDI